eukprot:2372920-Rhodomonas_salina.2
MRRACYARATRSPVLSERMVLRACYGKSGNEVGHGGAGERRGRAVSGGGPRTHAGTAYRMVLCGVVYGAMR